MADRLFKDVRLEGDERILVLCPTDSALLDFLDEEEHQGPILVVDFDASRLATIREISTALPNLLFTTWNLNAVSPPPRGSQPQAVFVDLDAAPSKQAAVFLTRAAASWSAGHAYVRGSRSAGMESVLREAELAGGLAVRDVKWRKGVGLAVVAALHANLTPGRRPVLGRRRVDGRELILEHDWFTFGGGDIDPASALLIDSVQLEGDELVLDLGCGGGIIGLALSRRLPHGFVVMTDSNRSSVALCRRNRLRNAAANTAVVLANGVRGLREAAFRVVALNPPMHSGRRDDRDLGATLVQAAFTACRTGGSVYVVANRFLPYHRLMESCGETDEIAGDSRFRVLRTIRG
jgi:16S rRNA G1207 methylase RsmC